MGRENLQWEGERLDRLTGGAWVKDEMQRVLDQVVSERALVVDAVRTLDQVRIIRESFKSTVDHIHLTAPEPTLAERYAARGPCNARSDLPGYAHVLQNETEWAVDTLRSVADIVIDTGIHNKIETFRMACAFLPWL